MQLDQEQMQLKIECTALAHVVTQMSLYSVQWPTTITDSLRYFPPGSNSLLLSLTLPRPPSLLPIFLTMLDQVRAHITQALCYPTPPPPALKIPHTAYMPLAPLQEVQAGPSRLPN